MSSIQELSTRLLLEREARIARLENSILVLEEKLKTTDSLNIQLKETLLRFYETNMTNEFVDVWPFTALHPNYALPTVIEEEI